MTEDVFVSLRHSAVAKPCKKVNGWKEIFMFEVAVVEYHLLYVDKNPRRCDGSLYIPKTIRYFLLAQPYPRRILGRAAPMNYSQGD